MIRTSTDWGKFLKPIAKSSRPMGKGLASLAVLLSLLTVGRADPAFVIPATTIFSNGNASNSGLFGSIYNFNTVAVPPASYTVDNILNNTAGFNPALVGSYQVTTSGTINYGSPDSSDTQPLTSWLGTDGATVVYNGTPHITEVFSNGFSQGTLLTLTGYIKITSAMLNTPQTFSLGLDDGGKLTINGVTVIDNGGIHGATVITQTAIFTVAGLYPIDIGYYDGHATQAVLTASFGLGSFFVSTPNGVAVQSIPLDPTATQVQSYLTTVAATNPTDPIFNNAFNALVTMSLNGADPATYGNAVKELSPLKYAALDAQMSGNVDFLTNDLDDYLAHRRTDAGHFRSGNGVDLNGMSVFNGGVDPGLQDISSHLLAFTGNDMARGTLSDSPAGLISTHNTDEKPWNFFTRGIVVLSQNLSNVDVPHTDTTTGTLQFGMDYQVTPHFLIGSFFSYSHGDGSLDNEGSEASSDSYMPGIYASYTDDGWFANGLVSGGVSNFDVKRNIVIPGFDATTHASPTGEEEYAYLSGGRDIHDGNWTYGPLLGLQYVHMTTDSFTENGAGLLDLNVNSHDNDSLRSRLGGRVSYAASGAGVVWRPFLDAAWQHEFMENSGALVSQFDGAGVGTFTVPSPVNSRDSAFISIGTDIDIDKDTNVFTVYRVEAGASHFFAQSVEAGVKVTF